MTEDDHNPCIVITAMEGCPGNSHCEIDNNNLPFCADEPIEDQGRVSMSVILAVAISVPICVALVVIVGCIVCRRWQGTKNDRQMAVRRTSGSASVVTDYSDSPYIPSRPKGQRKPASVITDYIMSPYRSSSSKFHHGPSTAKSDYDEKRRSQAGSRTSLKFDDYDGTNCGRATFYNGSYFTENKFGVSMFASNWDPDPIQ
ncbi:hypothetical protein ScPMuIL_003786 [Solemya velum]